MLEDFQGPLFVCGASRSGTALLRSSLQRHPRISLGPETHYFDDLRPRLGEAASSRLEGARRRQCEDYFLALAHRPYGHGGDPEEAPIRRQELRARADELGGDGDAYFEAFCRLANGGWHDGVWGEKTPRHVYRLADMLTRYPAGKAVVMVRDPRAVVASYRDWENRGGFDLERDPGHRRALELEQRRTRASYDPVIATLLWRGSVAAGLRARDRFGAGRVLVQRYEDLVSDLPSTLRDLAEWIGVPYDDAMTDVPVLNSSVADFDPHGGASTEPIRRWERRLSSDEIAVVQACAGKVLRGAGYRPEPVRLRAGAALRATATTPVRGLRAALANRERIPNLPAYLFRRVGAVMGRGRSRT